MSSGPIVIVTRGSPLALQQANDAATRLGERLEGLAILHPFGDGVHAEVACETDDRLDDREARGQQ